MTKFFWFHVAAAVLNAGCAAWMYELGNHGMAVLNGFAAGLSAASAQGQWFLRQLIRDLLGD